MLNRQKIAMLSAELLGTAILTYAAIQTTQGTLIGYFVAATVATTLGLLILTLGPVSGGHFNPAVTLAMWTARKIDTLQAAAYIAVQALGAVAALQTFEYISGKTVANQKINFDTPIWLAEAIGTFVFTMAIAAVMTRKYEGLRAAASIGGGLFIGISLAASGSSGILNPAVAIGLGSFSWAYVLGPALGAFLGVNGYMSLFSPQEEKPKGIKAKLTSKKK